ncbi:RIB43A-like with coiled-coils protein 1 isoform X1 [Anguilla rostrata]|uniref:RIB43A-like with coiled-coils protein 1 isoform X1 n=1 Tax=Anguilla rostrata TaxID=7938 RepID=UPI0030CB0B0E
MFKVEDSAAMAIERRRASETARKERIFDTRNRVIGLDLSKLQRQVEEKRERERVEKVRDKAFESLSAMHDALLKQQFAEEERRRAELSQELVQFRATHQRAQDSRDADLNFKELALNPPVSEEELGPSSMQVFQGGDCMARERKKAQMEENERLLKAQTQEKEKMRIHKKQTELLWGRAQVQQDFRELQLDATEEKCRRDAQVALSKYNLAQAAERAQQQKMDRLKEEGENFMEVWHMMTSDLLTECPEAAERGGGGAGQRVLLDRWKGMSAEQMNAIHKQREEQLAERERLREAKRQREAAWDSLQMAQSREGEEEEKRERERERQRRTEMDRYNMQLAREQQAHQQYLEKNLYTNRPAASYFTQFGSSSR